ncbi:MAG: AMP-binding protein, partial [Nostocaceae cyanobacterium]|nr:AMP-binding protein [Nostocaceae cyanobacterium]
MRSTTFHTTEATKLHLPQVITPESESLEVTSHLQDDYQRPECIHQLIESQIKRSSHKVAIAFENSYMTYGELNQRANQLAHYLQTLQVGPEVLVGICMERSLEMAIALLGILKAG